MDVRIDDLSVDLELGQCQTLRDLTEQVEAHVAGLHRIVTTITVDGVPLMDVNNEALELQPLSTIRRVDYATGNPRAISIQVLYGIGRVLPRLSGELQHVSRGLQGQDEQAAMMRFQHCLDHWMELHEGIQSATATLGLELNEVALNQGSAEDAFGLLLDLLDAASESMEAGDLLGLSDTLEYDLPQALKGVQAAVYAMINVAERKLH